MKIDHENNSIDQFYDDDMDCSGMTIEEIYNALTEMWERDTEMDPDVPMASGNFAGKGPMIERGCAIMLEEDGWHKYFVRNDEYIPYRENDRARFLKSL